MSTQKRKQPALLRVERSTIAGELISLTSRSGLWLDGILYQSRGGRCTVVHVHGSFGNFYANRWLRSMAQHYVSAGINFLVMNMATHDGLAEAYAEDCSRDRPVFQYVGHMNTPFNTCLDDLAAIVEFAGTLGDVVVLQGHSQGCDRVLWFLRHSPQAYPTIMLSPADTVQLLVNYLGSDSVDAAVERWQNSSPFDAPFDWLPISAYGVNQPPIEVYNIPICAATFVHLFTEARPALIDIEADIRFWVDAPCYVYIGGEDGFQTTDSTRMFQYFQRRFPRVRQQYVANGDHELKTCLEVVTESIVNWIGDETGGTAQA